MIEENTTEDALPGDENVQSPDSETADPQEGAGNDTPKKNLEHEPKADLNVLTLKELESTLGKRFPTKDAALKSFKDTYRALSREMNNKKIVPDDIQEKLSSMQKQLNEANFYSENPDYKKHRELIDSLGDNPSEVVKTDVFQGVYKKLKAHDEIEETKSVLHSNPRLGAIKDSMTKARESLKEGRIEDSRHSATQAVLEAFEK